MLLISPVLRLGPALARRGLPIACTCRPGPLASRLHECGVIGGLTRGSARGAIDPVRLRTSVESCLRLPSIQRADSRRQSLGTVGRVGVREHLAYEAPDYTVLDGALTHQLLRAPTDLPVVGRLPEA